jgi:hypothetical protein
MPLRFLFIFQAGFGSLLIWLTMRRDPIRGRDGKPWPTTQRFAKTSAGVLGAAMIIASIWGWYLAAK